MEEMKSNPLGSEKISKLMVKFAVPSIIGMIVSALYNIVDQLFIGNFVGALGNAATNIAFPFSTACIALSLMFGIGGASCFNLNISVICNMSVLIQHNNRNRTVAFHHTQHQRQIRTLISLIQRMKRLSPHLHLLPLLSGKVVNQEMRHQQRNNSNDDGHHY